MVDVLWELRKEINMSSKVMKKLESGIDVESIRDEIFHMPESSEFDRADVDRFQFVGTEEEEERYLKKSSRYGAAHGRLLGGVKVKMAATKVTRNGRTKTVYRPDESEGPSQIIQKPRTDGLESRIRFETWNTNIPGHGVEFTETGIIIATNGASSQVERELSQQTPTVWYYDCPELQKFFKWFTDMYGGTVRKANFYISPAGKGVSIHADTHSYFKDKDRFHLILAGKYEYTVNGETLVFRKGELWWFNNKAPHGSYNHGNEDKINLVFDVAGLRT